VIQRDEAIRRLPEPYAVALRLQGAGVTDAQLAAALDVAREAVPGLLRIAEAKLAEVLADAGGPPPT
jgi:DNA-directed RNA polymerase specialized sigma24 family protein